MRVTNLQRIRQPVESRLIERLKRVQLTAQTRMPNKILAHHISMRCVKRTWPPSFITTTTTIMKITVISIHLLYIYRKSARSLSHWPFTLYICSTPTKFDLAHR
ncbi:hypothetical protein Tcan_01142, partial [Toxocara canis]